MVSAILWQSQRGVPLLHPLRVRPTSLWPSTLPGSIAPASGGAETAKPSGTAHGSSWLGHGRPGLGLALGHG
jgi:hypothetical protein